MASVDNAVIKGVSYTRGQKFTVYANATGNGNAGGTSSASSTVKTGESYYFWSCNYTDSANTKLNKYPYLLATNSSGSAKAWFDAK